jgi:hypothetical protein
MIPWKNAVGLPKNPADFAKIVDDFGERLTSRGLFSP